MKNFTFKMKILLALSLFMFFSGVYSGNESYLFLSILMTVIVLCTSEVVRLMNLDLPKIQELRQSMLLLENALDILDTVQILDDDADFKEECAEVYDILRRAQSKLRG